MLTFPNAKINLGLNIVSKRADGYHNIETIFYPIPIKDALEIIPADETKFIQSGIRIDVPAEKNIVFKAYNIIASEYDLPKFNIHLLKNIPFGAGLGGGSSDAAFMLKMLNEICELNIGKEKLEEAASKIGADCAFFIDNKPVFATGIGNIFEPVEMSLEGLYMCLVKPDISVSTPQAYSNAKPAIPELSLKDIVKHPIEEWKNLMVNDFEKTVFPQFPEIAEIKEKLYESGAIYASMSGSGSSVFGIFREMTSLKESFPNCFVWEGKI